MPRRRSSRRQPSNPRPEGELGAGGQPRPERTTPAGTWLRKQDLDWGYPLRYSGHYILSCLVTTREQLDVRMRVAQSDDGSGPPQRRSFRPMPLGRLRERTESLEVGGRQADGQGLEIALQPVATKVTSA